MPAASVALSIAIRPRSACAFSQFASVLSVR